MTGGGQQQDAQLRNAVAALGQQFAGLAVTQPCETASRQTAPAATLHFTRKSQGKACLCLAPK